VLDEPSIGLHPRDIDRLLGLLQRLRDAGNTVVVVEHDPAAIARADFMLELGPGAGEHGGRLVYAGPPAGATESLTGQYLSGQKRIGVPSARRPLGSWLRVRGATLHNLKGVDVDVPLGALTAVTGVSGSGKSTLVHDVLCRQLEGRLRGGHSAKAHLGEPVGSVDSFVGWELLDDVLLVDQSPIGRTPRSNPVTYIRAFDEIRELFAAQPESRMRGYTPATFSFNMPGGRCEECQGAGAVQVEMVFLADVFVPCEVCGGTRFKREVLEVIAGVRLPMRCSSRWTTPSSASGTSRNWARRSGTCNRSASATSDWASQQPRSRAERRSASRSRASWPSHPSEAAASSTSWTSRPRDYIWTMSGCSFRCSIGW
jgi:excinuclease ABC subunit A